MGTMENKVASATFWSFTTEILAKMISPVTNMILARLLSPEAFGIVATVTMITSFAELISEAGFHRYVIQSNYENDEEKNKSISVAFWSNMVFSLIIWMIIVMFRNPIAYGVGAEELGNVIAISAITIPLMSFCSIQTAVLKRSLNFRTLFYLRVISCAVPLLVTVPLAYIYRNFWALILGTIILQCVNVVVLIIFSKWKPMLFFRFGLLRKMLSFSIWSMLEQLAVWLTANVGIFVVGRMFTSYYTGMYKVTITTVNQVLGIISTAIISVAFSALSRCTLHTEFEKLYFKFEKMMAIFLIPISFGILVFRDTVTDILLGSQWTEASIYLGIWGFARGFVLVLGSLSSEAFKAKGRPVVACASQLLYLAFLIPTLYFSAQKGFECFMYAQTAVSFMYIVIQGIFKKFIIKLNFLKTITNISRYIFASIVMGTIGLAMLQNFSGKIFFEFLSIGLCAMTYFGVVFFFKKERDEIIPLLKAIRNKIRR